LSRKSEVTSSHPLKWGASNKTMIDTNKIYNMDCFDGFKEIEDNSIDVILTDPPYFLPAVHYNTRRNFSRNFADLGILEHFFRGVIQEFNRVIKKTGTIYMFCDGQSYPLFYYHLYPFCKSVRPLIWDKKTSINGYSWRHQHELIIFAEMPEAKPVPSGDGDILRFSAVKVDERVHPAEKPIQLLQQLIEKSTKKGDLILDPFAGSGTTLIAAKLTERQYSGFEKAAEYYTIAEQRLTEVVPIPPTTNVVGILGTFL
jgi:site-specific DNA-methyltransferase (adenine-specific)